MAKGVSMAVLVVMMAVAATIHCSAAQTVHVVDWSIPDGGFVTYTAWAAMQNFTVGDTLVFNFTTRDHDVAQVTREAFLLCNTTIPTISLTYTGPANITLDTAGEHYFFCTFGGHCLAGQRLAINVTKASSPSPPPAPTPAPAPDTTPAPTSAPTPAPSRSPVNYTVGDDIGWIIPPGGIIAYQAWALNKTFIVGDTLVFNFNETIDDVAEVTKTAYVTCDSNTTISNYTNSPASITLTTPGEHFYLCTTPKNCFLGQRLAINVTGSSTATSPSTPPSTSATPPSIATPPSSTPTTTPSPPGSTATTPTPGSNAPSFTAAAGFSAALLSIAVAYLLY